MEKDTHGGKQDERLVERLNKNTLTKSYVEGVRTKEIRERRMRKEV